MNTILSAGRITLDEIERKWVHASLNENGDTRLPRSSFNAMREQVEVMFGVTIRCDRRTNEYYVEGDVRQLRGRRDVFKKDTELMYLTYCENYSMRQEAEELDAEDMQD